MSQEQLDRMETKLDSVIVLVNKHDGFITAIKWMTGGLGAGFSLLMGFFTTKGH